MTHKGVIGSHFWAVPECDGSKPNGGNVWYVPAYAVETLKSLWADPKRLVAPMRPQKYEIIERHVSAEIIKIAASCITSGN